jgi:dihydrofolate reductase
VKNRKCILYIATSIDGFIADEFGGIKWIDEFGKGEGDNGYAEFLKTIDIVIMGRKTYDQVLTFGNFPYGEMKCYIYSRAQKTIKDNIEFTNESVDLLIPRLKQQIGKDIWLIGGADLIDSFLKFDLIDVFIITLIPVILGKGIPLFSSDHPRIALTVKNVRILGDFVQYTYEKKE